jgi:hypothetical protein
MKDRDVEPKFSLTMLLVVTGISFLIFCAILRLLNGSYPHIFLWIAIACFGISFLKSLGSLSKRAEKPSPPQVDQ